MKLIQLILFQECRAKFQSIPQTIPVDPLAEGGHPSVNSVFIRSTSDPPTDDADLTFVDHQRSAAISLRFINSTMNGGEGRNEDNEDTYTAGVFARCVSTDHVIDYTARCPAAEISLTVLLAFNAQIGFL